MEYGGGSWIPDPEDPSLLAPSGLFAYCLSIACMHCQDPACVAACPTEAIHQRPDGIVLIDSARCAGCRYCEWACPYGALSFDPSTGRMTKCDMCVDLIDAGEDPWCVASCVTRALEVGPVDDLRAEHGSLDALAPLPDRRSDPPPPGHHPPPGRTARRPGHWPLLQPGAGPAMTLLHEWPLVLFTLTVQLAVGLHLALLATKKPTSGPGDPAGSRPRSEAPRARSLLVGVLMAAALAVSLLHLGAPLSAVHSLSNLEESWLSREILVVLVFLGLWGFRYWLGRRPGCRTLDGQGPGMGHGPGGHRADWGHGQDLHGSGPSPLGPLAHGGQLPSDHPSPWSRRRGGVPGASFRVGSTELLTAASLTVPALLAVGGRHPWPRWGSLWLTL